MTEERPRKKAKAVHEPDTETPAKVMVESKPTDKTLELTEEKVDDIAPKLKADDAGKPGVEAPTEATPDISTPIEPLDAQAERAKYTSEDYQGVLRLITYVEDGHPTMYDAKCLEEAADHMNRHKRDTSAPGLEADDNYREDGFPTLDNRPESEWDGGIYYSCENAIRGDMERVSWKKLVSRVGWLEESWFQCPISRFKPADVQSADIARVKLLDVEVRGPGRLYLTGPPGEFWMWNVEEFKEEGVGRIRMVIGEIVGF